MQTPALDPACAAYLSAKYPKLTSVGLECMWEVAWGWVEEQVASRYLRAVQLPHAFHVAALFRVHFICTHDNPQLRQAYTFAANEAIQPYRC